MPWKIRQGGGCPPSKPWAVVLQADGSTVACHPTKGHAEAHMRALYANESKMAVHGWTVEQWPEGLTASAWKPAGVLDDFDTRYLAKMTAALNDTFSKMRALAVSRLRASALVASPFTLDDPNVFTAQDWADMFSVDAVDIIGDVVVDAATGSPLKIGLNLSDDDLVKLVDAHVQHLLGVGSDVAQSVSDTMQMAVKDGWSVDQTARELAATGPFSPDGARSFARTEISSAANAGMVAGWQADGTVGKIWLAVLDARCRAEHAFADGTTVPVGEDFTIGGYPASAPGDLRLPPHLRISCRCSLEPVSLGGKTQATSIDTAGKKDLYRLAAQLKVRGRSTMSKAQLFDSIDAYRRGEGVQRIDRQTRAQLLTRAKDAGIRGRHSMDTATLRAELFARAPGARRALDAGYVVEGELSAIRAQVASVLKRTAIVAGAGWVVDHVDEFELQEPEAVIRDGELAMQPDARLVVGQCRFPGRVERAESDRLVVEFDVGDRTARAALKTDTLESRPVASGLPSVVSVPGMGGKAQVGQAVVEPIPVDVVDGAVRPGKAEQVAVHEGQVSVSPTAGGASDVAHHVPFASGGDMQSPGEGPNHVERTQVNEGGDAVPKIHADGLIPVIYEHALIVSNDATDEFHNVWHDERGRFAPKGTGRSVATKGVAPPPEPAKPVVPSMGGSALWKSLDKTSTTNANPAETKARDAYISNGKGGYKDMNGCSRGKGCSKAITKKNEELDSLIGKSTLPADADLHRGVTFKSAAERDAFVAGLTPGGSFADKGFFSTTADPKVVKFFQTTPGQSVLFRVHAPAGTHATTGEQSEREVIFGRGQQWRVRSVGGNGRPPVIELESVGALAASAATSGATPTTADNAGVALSAGFLDRMSDIVLEPVGG